VLRVAESSFEWGLTRSKRRVLVLLLPGLSRDLPQFGTGRGSDQLSRPEEIALCANLEQVRKAASLEGQELALIYDGLGQQSSPSALSPGRICLRCRLPINLETTSIDRGLLITTSNLYALGVYDRDTE